MYKIDSNDGTVLADTLSLTGTNLPVRTFVTSPSGIKTNTGHDFIRKNRLEIGNKLKAKVSLSSPYNTSTTTVFNTSTTTAFNTSTTTNTTSIVSTSFSTSFDTSTSVITTWYDPSTRAHQPGDTVHHPRS